MPADRSSERVTVFIDGQNLYKGLRHGFGHGLVHPLLLARELVGDRQLVEVRYFSGIPDSRVDPDANRRENRRHRLLRATGVAVFEKKLTYRWQWLFDKRRMPNPFHHQLESRTTKVTSKERGQEKGIDVWLALDALLTCQRDDIDAIIVVSADRDLDQIPIHVHALPATQRARVENAIIRRDDKRHPFVNELYAFTHQITREMMEAARDDFVYTKKLDKGEVKAFLASL